MASNCDHGLTVLSTVSFVLILNLLGREEMKGDDTMKRLVIVLMVLVLVGCGNQAENNGIDNVDVSKNKIEITTDEGQEITVSNDMGESVDLPDAYPKDIIPIYKDAHIVAAAVNPDNSLMVMGLCNGEMKEVVDFYKEVLKDAEVIMEQNAADIYLNMGTFKGIGYTVTVSNSEMEDYDYKNSFSIIIMEEVEGLTNDVEETTDNETETVDKAPAKFVMPDTITWPEDYPNEIIPLYDNAYTEAKMAMKQGDETMVSMMTEDEIDVVLDYYSGLLESAIDFSTMDLQGTIMVAGTIDEVMITIMLLENDGSLGEDERFRTLIQIIYN